MKAIIMAGGEGSRLRPLTCDLPKPMVPVMNLPVMDYSISLLKSHDIREIGVTLQYRPEQIIDSFQDGSEKGVNLHYFIEETPLGTAGSVKNACSFLDQTFIVISGDALTDINLSEAIEFHKKKGSKATLVLKKVQVPLEYGVVVTDDSGNISRFLEKPNWGEVFSDTINTGIYILEPDVLEYFETGRKFDFSKDLFPLLLMDKQPIYGYISNGYWCDIGNTNTYLNAHYDMLDGRVQLSLKKSISLVKGDNIQGTNIFIGKNTEIDESAKLVGPCYIGDYTHIGKDVIIGPYTVIGAHCTIKEHSSIKRSVLWDHVHIGKNGEIRGAIICNKVYAGNRVSVYEGAVIGTGCQLLEDSTIKPSVNIWPEKTIEKGSIIQSNIVWGTRERRYLFGKDGISGTMNTDMHPQNVVRIGAAFGAYLKPGKRTAISCDQHPVSTMLKHGLISGLLSTGIEVYDLGPITTPVLRYAVQHLALDAGIHISLNTNIVEKVIIHFVDSNGCSLPADIERKLENLYIRDDFQREDYNNIKRVHIMADVSKFYIRSLLDSINEESVRNKGFRILVSARSSKIGNYLLQSILKELNCEIRICKTDTDINDLLKTGRYDIGCILDPNAESIQLYDEKGEQIRKEYQSVLICLLYMKQKPGGKVVVPYTASNVIEKLANTYKCDIVRTKSNKLDIMLESKGTDLFSIYFDGIALLIKLLERMSLDNVALSQLINEIPDIYWQEKEIPCPWEKKGAVMRALIEEGSQSTGGIRLFEGVRIQNDKGWALILPDSEEPVCKVYSEGWNEEFTEELASYFEKRIQDIQIDEKEN
jgi:mannose-1-phosphate guanylyltransferase/phosphomannomutase